MFETERLILRKLLPTDLKAIFKMRKDPFVMRYIRGPQTDLDSSVKWIEMMTDKWDSEKIGFCGVVEKSTGDFIGWCGLWRLVGTDDIEVGYAIRKDHWGKGYATEAAARCLEYGFNDLGFSKIVAVAYPENKASQNVMKKIGMKYVQTGIFYEKTLVQFAISAEEYFSSSTTSS
ncbi:MAG: GNAT family N-acetyltransferase [Acidobacteria bacterium]|nr:GNAT family N-acetyltransferase [Acidobacteriota bacterium]